jgi:hypothetical protein
MKYKVRIVRLSEIKSDPAVNRQLDDSWVSKLAANWDEAKAGMVVLSDRGAYFVPLDGQHRIEAMRQLTADDRRVEALVHEGLTLAQEAYLFLALNDDRPVRPFDKFEKLVTAEDSTACHIVAILDALALRVEMGSRAGAVGAVVALQRIYRWDPTGELLRSTLTVAKQAWGRDASSFYGDILSGIGLFLRAFPEVNTKRLSNVLARSANGVSGLIGKGRTLREMHGGTVAGGVAEAVQSLYNKGLKNKLDRP